MLDTLGIENFISVPYTEGPKLARQLEEHVRDNGIDVMNLAEAAQRLIPAKRPGGWHELVLKNGAIAVGAGGGAGDGRALAQPRGAGRARVPHQQGVAYARTATGHCSRASAWR